MGPADHKIWFTSKISADSLGQGTKVPVQMLPQEFLTRLNDTLDQLAYRQVDDSWQKSSGPVDPRTDAPHAATSATASGQDADVEAAAAEISARLAQVTAEQAVELAGRWPQAARREVCLAIAPPGPGVGARRCWVLSFRDSALAIRQDQAPPGNAVTLAAPARAWLALLGGTANLAAELRAGRMRLLDPSAVGDSPPTRPDVTRLLARLTGLAGQPEVSTTTSPS